MAVTVEAKVLPHPPTSQLMAVNSGQLLAASCFKPIQCIVYTSLSAPDIDALHVVLTQLLGSTQLNWDEVNEQVL